QYSIQGGAAVEAWRASHAGVAWATGLLGLHRAYTNPVFLAILALLGISTAICAVDRTRFAMRSLRSAGGIPTATLERLARRDVIAVVPEPSDPARTAVMEALRRNRLTPRATPNAVEAAAGRLGPLGSPVFHWALAALFAVIALGQLTRSEGLIGVPVGGSLPNVAASYGSLNAGLLHPGLYRNLTIAVTEMPLDIRKGSVVIGAVPTVQLRRGDTVVAQGAVYPNHPLRYRSLLVHYMDNGYVATARTVNQDGSVAGVDRLYFDQDASSPGGLASARLNLTAAQRSFDLTLTPVKATSDTSRSIEIEYPTPSGGTLTTTVPIGTTADLGFVRITLDDVRRYARLSVADDWSVYPMYALFVLATAGMVLAVFFPRRTAWVLLTEKDGATELRYLTYHQRKDPAFDVGVEEALLALGTQPGGHGAESPEVL
ncbi:MAG: cytochrome c biogenesis protein ResB, partial [Actinobacteria bacterium]